MNLFIGGSNDGQRMEVPKSPAFPKIQIPAINMVKKYSRGPFNSAPDRELYTARVFSAGEKILTIYVIEGMSDYDAMLRLIEHYNPMNF